MKEKNQSVVCTDPLLSVVMHLVDRVYGDAVPEEIEVLLSQARAKNKPFVPPTEEEVLVEMKRIGVQNPEYHANKWWNFYASKNWMIGKNKMKSWKSALKTWDLPIAGKKGLVV